MKLSRRLEEILGLCQPVDTAADVGCDHGYVACELADRGLAKRVIAADISAPSLEKARHLAQRRFLPQIECRLGAGLRILRPGEAQGIVLAGMGAPLIMHILEEGREVAQKAEFLVLSPGNYPDRLRKFLLDSGYAIEEERMIHEDKFYPVMLAVPGACALYSETELLIGRYRKLTEDLREYIEFKIRQTDEIIRSLRAAGKPLADRKRENEQYRQYLLRWEEF